uniref:ER membrane protein complex subunit 6 n=1 Tax=Chromera velia CCMP2878 TaxID=1169474 RepID=A0A0G4FW70_9ALVE|mmetsp:Transcript_6185/g.12234  ORF Transcript_6185/g.12234 Transcript_6185/m.12234 type:complete len:117 (-) Transcript_6185:234-584(-)|eukprot:Cvel_19041.t1-p1 / transcript=Cvel_19041.t1 / gene=Cvel_19041 / organism=Chromera_velia_CCMP2878 / gene_product=ER membrane protein complex subunit 6, putative / transcript_product=ER membrane protein complex subunit 6, putative / location=Cvel_scaffold1614:13895-16520(-) / protein_length=116 / sequence_SO=supercontig / SO=protein_coding / is_pseudo=false
MQPPSSAVSEEPGENPSAGVVGSSLAYNRRILSYCRNYAAIVGGVAAGLCGATSLQGVLFFLVSALLMSGVLLVRMGFNFKPYFLTMHEVVGGQLFAGLLSFILFWTLVYDIVYIF